MELPEDILLRTPEEASRRVGLALLSDAHAAARRLSDPGDVAALHDFRVAIRRLRSLESAWRDALADAIPRRLRRRLRDLQHATGAGRDAEVLLEWLLAQRPLLRLDQRMGHDWLVDRLRARKREGYRLARRRVRKDFTGIDSKLGARLERMTVQVQLIHPAARPTWAARIASAARRQAVELADRAARVTSSEEQTAAHRFRIAAKRLRYLVEPIRRDLPAARDVVARLKSLQDTLGDMHDTMVLIEELAASMVVAATERERRLEELSVSDRPVVLRREARCTEQAGLIELDRRAHARLEELFARLQRDWLSGGVEELTAAVNELALALDALARPPIEVERKYLLDALPEAVKGAPSVEIDQGYLPGRVLRERLRRKHGAGETRYYRTVKLGHGVQRFELEEETSQEVFEAMWPLTEGCRVRKRRHLLRKGERLWEVDEFLDRALVLAEVELPSAGEVVTLPPWLEAHVVREVTGDPDYLNLNLAR